MSSTTNTRLTSARTVAIQNHARGGDDLSNLPEHIFAAKDIPLPNPIPEDSALLRTLYISNDPAQAIWIQAHNLDSQGRRDMSALPVGSPMHAFTLSRVLEVGGPDAAAKIHVGDIVEARTHWAGYTVVKKEKLTPIKLVSLRLTTHAD